MDGVIVTTEESAKRYRAINPLARLRPDMLHQLDMPDQRSSISVFEHALAGRPGLASFARRGQSRDKLERVREKVAVDSSSRATSRATQARQGGMRRSRGSLAHKVHMIVTDTRSIPLEVPELQLRLMLRRLCPVRKATLEVVALP